MTDSEQFYNSILELLEDPDEINEVVCLLSWWNWFVLFFISDTFLLMLASLFQLVLFFLLILQALSLFPRIVLWP